MIVYNSDSKENKTEGETEMAAINVTEEARKIYEKQQAQRPQMEQYLGANRIPAVMKATVEELEAHIQNCEDARQHYHLDRLAWEAIPYGSTREQVFAFALTKCRQASGRKGKRALTNKYGAEAADRIIKQAKGR